MHHLPNYRLAATVLLALSALTGCTTMKAIETTGDEISQGNILSGIWTGTMGVAMGALVDVFTLGGSMDAQDSAQVWTGATNQYAAARQQGTATAYTPPPATPTMATTASAAAMYSPPPATTSANLTYPIATESASTPAVVSAAGQESAPSGTNASHCLKLG